MLNKDELWEKANTKIPITLEDIGIDREVSNDGLQTYTEGFTLKKKEVN